MSRRFAFQSAMLARRAAGFFGSFLALAALSQGCGANVVASTGTGGSGGASPAASACATYCANPACAPRLEATSANCLQVCEGAVAASLLCLPAYTGLFMCMAATATCDFNACPTQEAALGGCCDSQPVGPCYAPWVIDGGTGAASGG